MLKQLRQKKTMKRILWVLALIIIPAFVLWGAGGLRESKNYAGMVFGKRVTLDEYRKSFAAARNKAFLLYGSDFYKMQEELDLDKAAWERIIMLKEAERQKIRASDEEVIARIASMPFFQNSEGYFSQRNYVMILNNTFRTSPRQFEEEMRQSMTIEKLAQPVFASVPEPLDTEIEEAIRKEREEIEGDKGKEGEEEGEEIAEETEEERRERIRNELLMKKRLDVYQGWLTDLYRRAQAISYLEKEEEEETEEVEVE